MRNNSNASVDQGYISASPCTTDVIGNVVSPSNQVVKSKQHFNKVVSRSQRIPSPSSSSSSSLFTGFDLVKNNYHGTPPIGNMYTVSHLVLYYKELLMQLNHVDGLYLMTGSFTTDMLNNDPFEDQQQHSHQDTGRSCLFPYSPLDDHVWKQQQKKQQQQQQQHSSLSLPLVEGKEMDFAKAWRTTQQQVCNILLIHLLSTEIAKTITANFLDFHSFILYINEMRTCGYLSYRQHIFVSKRI